MENSFLSLLERFGISCAEETVFDRASIRNLLNAALNFDKEVEPPLSEQESYDLKTLLDIVYNGVLDMFKNDK